MKYAAHNSMIRINSMGKHNAEAEMALEYARAQRESPTATPVVEYHMDHDLSSHTTKK